MAFTVTVNGTEYTEADFQPSNYHLNFPSFLRDCTEHYPNSLTARAMTYGNSSFDPSSIRVVGEGKAFHPGMPVLFYNTARTNLYFCTVTTYNPLTEIMTCSIQNYSVAETVHERSEWWCVGGSRMNEIAYGVYTGLSATGQTTVSGVKEGCGQGSPSTRLAYHFEDFMGCVPSLETSGLTVTSTETGLPGIFFSVTGGGKITPNLNQSQLFCSANCPGVVELSVTNRPDCAIIVSQGTVSASTGHTATFRVFIPESVEGEEIEFHLGLSDSPLVTYDVELLIASFLSFNSIAVPLKGKKLIEGRYTTGQDGFEQAFGASYNKDSVWEQGRWLCVNFTKLVSGLYSATVSDDSGENSYIALFPGAPTAGAVFSGAYPFIMLSKKRGSKESKLYVDYIGSGDSSITR